MEFVNMLFDFQKRNKRDAESEEMATYIRA